MGEEGLAEKAPEFPTPEGNTSGWKGPGEGPRERLARMGASALTDPELLMVLLGTGTRQHPVHELAQSLLDMRGGLKALVLLPPSELSALPGLGLARAARVLAALELGRRVQRKQEERPRLHNATEVYQYLRPVLSALRKEVFHVLSFNSRNILLHDARVAEGTMNACPVDPREVFSAALAAKATAIVLAHNHPSGDPEPSAQDLALTAQIVDGGRLLGIKVLDHLVVGDGTFTSMMERRLMSRGGFEGRPLNSRPPLTDRAER